MKEKITVIGSQLKTTHYDGGKKGENFTCKVILHDFKGGGAVEVGTLRVPLSLVPESHIDGEGDSRTVRQGEYLTDWRCSRKYNDDGITGGLCEFTPFQARPKADTPQQPPKAA